MSVSLFASDFYDCLISSETSSRFSFSDYFRNEYKEIYDFCDILPHLLCHGNTAVTSPFSYEIAGLNAFCLLYTKKGAGKLFFHENILPPPWKIPANCCPAPSLSLTAARYTSLSVCITSGNIRSVSSLLP